MADPLAEDIIAIITAHAEPQVQITPVTELAALGIHSLELTEIIFEIEDTYKVEIDMNTVEAWSHLRSVGDIVEAVRAVVDKKKA